MTMLYPFYAPSEAELNDLLDSAFLGRLITHGDSGIDVGLFPFVRIPTGIEIHLNKADAQLHTLREHPACAFQVDDMLSRVPSSWVHPETATYADAFYRSVTIFGNADVIDDDDALIDHLETLLLGHQGADAHIGLRADPGRYASALSRIRLVRITQTRRQAKFKLGQQEPEPIREQIVHGLRNRNDGHDARAADYVEQTLDAHRASSRSSEAEA